MRVFTNSLARILWSLNGTFYSTPKDTTYWLEEKEMNLRVIIHRTLKEITFTAKWNDGSQVANFLVRFIHNSETVKRLFSGNYIYTTILVEEFEEIMLLESDGHAIIVQFVLLDQVDRIDKDGQEIEIPNGNHDEGSFPVLPDDAGIVGQMNAMSFRDAYLFLENNGLKSRTAKALCRKYENEGSFGRIFTASFSELTSIKNLGNLLSSPTIQEIRKLRLKYMPQRTET